MTLTLCDDSFSEPIRAIYNDAIVNSTVLYETEPRTPATMAEWFAAKRAGDFPVIAAVDGPVFLGFGTFGPFRWQYGYRHAVEHAVYVAAEHRGKGVGKRLLAEVIAEVRKRDYHTLIGVIDSGNAASIGLHRRFGFEFAGRLREAGYKFGRWLDADFYQLILDTPMHPTER